jgi:alcohol dehydrogenase
MNYNVPGAMLKFAEVAQALDGVTENLSVREAAFLSVDLVEALIADCAVMDSLESLGVAEEDFPELARIALTVARPLANNPRPVTLEDAVDIYRDAF